jgi:nitrate reductase alpha subunit
MIYRSILNITTLCGCQGVNGGGWAHYVGQEKVRPQASWAQVSFGLDWNRPPRQQNGTSFYYFATDQWRYDNMDSHHLLSPLIEKKKYRHMADYNVFAARQGWLPSYPQFDRNPIDLCKEAVDQGAASNEEIIEYTVDKLKKGEIQFSIEDPDNPVNFPRILFLWRANLLGASGKGHEYFLKHLLGVESAVFNKDSAVRPEEIRWRDPAPEGKLDLLVTMELRMSTSAMYSDVALPAASSYEMHDLSTTDMHTPLSIHSILPSIRPGKLGPTGISLRPLRKNFPNWRLFTSVKQKISWQHR